MYFGAQALKISFYVFSCGRGSNGGTPTLSTHLRPRRNFLQSHSFGQSPSEHDCKVNGRGDWEIVCARLCGFLIC